MFDIVLHTIWRTAHYMAYIKQHVVLPTAHCNIPEDLTPAIFLFKATSLMCRVPGRELAIQYNI